MLCRFPQTYVQPSEIVNDNYDLSVAPQDLQDDLNILRTLLRRMSGGPLDSAYPLTDHVGGAVGSPLLYFWQDSFGNYRVHNARPVDRELDGVIFYPQCWFGDYTMTATNTLWVTLRGEVPADTCRNINASRLTSTLTDGLLSIGQTERPVETRVLTSGALVPVLTMTNTKVELETITNHCAVVVADTSVCMSTLTYTWVPTYTQTVVYLPPTLSRSCTSVQTMVPSQTQVQTMVGGASQTQVWSSTYTGVQTQVYTDTVVPSYTSVGGSLSQTSTRTLIWTSTNSSVQNQAPGATMVQTNTLVDPAWTTYTGPAIPMGYTIVQSDEDYYTTICRHVVQSTMECIGSGSSRVCNEATVEFDDCSEELRVRHIFASAPIMSVPAQVPANRTYTMTQTNVAWVSGTGRNMVDIRTDTMFSTFVPVSTYSLTMTYTSTVYGSAGSTLVGTQIYTDTLTQVVVGGTDVQTVVNQPTLVNTYTQTQVATLTRTNSSVMSPDVTYTSTVTLVHPGWVSTEILTANGETISSGFTYEEGRQVSITTVTNNFSYILEVPAVTTYTSSWTSYTMYDHLYLKPTVVSTFTRLTTAVYTSSLTRTQISTVLPQPVQVDTQTLTWTNTLTQVSSLTQVNTWTQVAGQGTMSQTYVSSQTYQNVYTQTMTGTYVVSYVGGASASWTASSTLVPSVTQSCNDQNCVSVVTSTRLETSTLVPTLTRVTRLGMFALAAQDTSVWSITATASLIPTTTCTDVVSSGMTYTSSQTHITWIDTWVPTLDEHVITTSTKITISTDRFYPSTIAPDGSNGGAYDTNPTNHVDPDMSTVTETYTVTTTRELISTNIWMGTSTDLWSDYSTQSWVHQQFVSCLNTMTYTYVNSSVLVPGSASVSSTQSATTETSTMVSSSTWTDVVTQTLSCGAAGTNPGGPGGSGGGAGGGAGSVSVTTFQTLTVTQGQVPLFQHQSTNTNTMIYFETLDCTRVLTSAFVWEPTRTLIMTRAVPDNGEY